MGVTTPDDDAALVFALGVEATYLVVVVVITFFAGAAASQSFAFANEVVVASSWLLVTSAKGDIVLGA